MKKLIFTIQFLLLVTVIAAQKLPIMNYTINVTQNTDTFMVTLSLDKKLSKTATIFQFASTAPGTYQTMNIGRLVSNFRALDKKGKELTVTKKSVNQFEIKTPNKVSKVTYRVAETFDTTLEEYPIYPMAGSSIERDHALINSHTVLGYFTGYQKSPIRLKLERPTEWAIGTALNKDGDIFVADDFDHAVDSPILAGNLSFSDTTVASTKVEIFAYSQSGKIESSVMLANMSDMLDATRKYLINLPV
ncbi:MAG: peptidase, partial [Cyclobacteriaceae bacterium]